MFFGRFRYLRSSVWGLESGIQGSGSGLSDFPTSGLRFRVQGFWLVYGGLIVRTAFATVSPRPMNP